MNTIRLIIDSLPEVLPIPKELHYKKVEILFLPLEQVTELKIEKKRPYALAKNDFSVPDSFFEPLPDDEFILKY